MSEKSFPGMAPGVHVSTIPLKKGGMLSVKKQEGAVDTCINKISGHVDDPGAFCGSLHDKALGTTSWRGKEALLRGGTLKPKEAWEELPKGWLGASLAQFHRSIGGEEADSGSTQTAVLRGQHED